jgi:serine phosphatase RsbU (regulator of sigma subunit)
LLSEKLQKNNKEKENQLLQTRNQLSNETIKQQKTFSYFIVSALILTIALAFFIFNGLKKQREANAVISEQKIIVETQKNIVEEKHKEITDSINYAERIQRSFLASKELLADNLNEHFVFFQPKDVVSGDFYWASKLSNGDFALATADSTGHGVPGAIMSILNISSLEKAVEQGLYEPAQILNHTRKTIIERLKKDGSTEGGKDGMDCSLICFDFSNSQFKYASANNPIWVVRENDLIELTSDKMPVGKHDKDQNAFTQHNFKLQKGDMVYTLTDGMPDQFGGQKGKKFMYKQLKEFLVVISQLPMEIQKQKLSGALDNWKGNLEQVDDICVIGIKI